MPPPLALNSPEFAADLHEIRTMGIFSGNVQGVLNRQLSESNRAARDGEGAMRAAAIDDDVVTRIDVEVAGDIGQVCAEVDGSGR